MSTLVIVLIAASGLIALLGLAIYLATRGRGPVIAEAVIVDEEDHTVMDESGAVRSTQAADLTLPVERIGEIWTPRDLERLARTYWRYLTRCTLGVIRVKYTERARYVCILFRAFTILSFKEPEYAMDAERGLVRWRINKGLLVGRKGRGADGYLQIDVSRSAPDENGQAVLHVEVEVANFYPAIASGISKWLYKNTQSRIHVIVTHGFLYSLARLDLAESRVGRFAQDTLPEGGSSDTVPDPPLPALVAEKAA